MNIKFLKSKNLMNSFWIIAEQILQMLISLIVGVLSARFLGPDNYGTLSYTASFVTFATSIATLGMEAVVIKKMVAFPQNEGLYLGSCILLRFIASLISMAVLVLVVYVLNPSEPIKALLVFLQSFKLIFMSVQILDSWFQRHLLSKYISIAKLVASVIVSVYKIFLLVTAKNIIWFAISNSLSDFVIAIIMFIFYKKENGQFLKVNLSAGINILQDSYHFILSGLMAAICAQMDKVMIGQMLSNTEVGLYTTAATICNMWIFVPMAIINSFRPMIFEIKQSGNEQKYLLRLKQLYSGIIWICIGVSVFITALAPFIISILYGEVYMGAVSSLRIYIWCETFSMIGSARGIWILCENKNKYVKYFLGVGALTNLILNVILIPMFGIDGASIATLITQFVASLIAPLCFKGTRVHTKYVLEAFAFKWFWDKHKLNNTNI